ncbi:hypothetical protein L1887_53996 [Cichorium endivia]|nr:hypothetical protein L1887_53996 [Cichorium endivia]
MHYWLSFSSIGIELLAPRCRDFRRWRGALCMARRSDTLKFRAWKYGDAGMRITACCVAGCGGVCGAVRREECVRDASVGSPNGHRGHSSDGGMGCRTEPNAALALGEAQRQPTLELRPSQGCQRPQPTPAILLFITNASSRLPSSHRIWSICKPSPCRMHRSHST